MRGKEKGEEEEDREEKEVKKTNEMIKTDLHILFDFSAEKWQALKMIKTS